MKTKLKLNYATSTFFIEAIFLFSCLIVAASSFLASFHGYSFYGIDYWALAIFIFSLYATYSIVTRANFISIFSENSRQISLYILLLSAILLVHYAITKSTPITFWLDEYLQYYIPPYVNLTYEAARQQQPPIDYYLSQLTIALFGETEASVRFSPTIFSILSIIALTTSLLTFKIHFHIFLIVLTILLTNRSFIWYSQEARPIAMSIFFGLMCTYYYLKAFFNTTEDSKFLEKDKLYFFISGVLLHLSTGLQPSIIFLTFFLVYLIKIGKSGIRNNLKNILMITLPVLVSLPYVILIILRSISENQFLITANKYELLKNHVRDIYSNPDLISLNITNQFILSLAFILIVILCFCSYKNKKIQNKDLYVLFTTYFFSLISYSVITSIINWQLFERYFIAIFLSSLLIYAFIISKTLDELEAYFRQKFKTYSLLAMLLHLLIITGAFLAISKQFQENKRVLTLRSSHRSDWKSAADTLHNQHNITSYVHSSLPYHKISFPHLPSYGLSLYAPENQQSTHINNVPNLCGLSNTVIRCSRLIDKLKRKSYSHMQHLVLTQQLEPGLAQDYLKNPNWENVLKDHTIVQSNRLLFIALPFDANIQKNLVDLYWKIINLSPESEANFYLLEELFHYYIDQKKLDFAKNTLDAIDKIPLKKNLSPSYTVLNDYDKHIHIYINYMRHYLSRMTSK